MSTNAPRFPSGKAHSALQHAGLKNGCGKALKQKEADALEPSVSQRRVSQPESETALRRRSFLSPAYQEHLARCSSPIKRLPGIDGKLPLSLPSQAVATAQAGSNIWDKTSAGADGERKQGVLTSVLVLAPAPVQAHGSDGPTGAQTKEDQSIPLVHSPIKKKRRPSVFVKLRVQEEEKGGGQETDTEHGHKHEVVAAMASSSGPPAGTSGPGPQLTAEELQALMAKATEAEDFLELARLAGLHAGLKCVSRSPVKCAPILRPGAGDLTESFKEKWDLLANGESTIGKAGFFELLRSLHKQPTGVHAGAPVGRRTSASRRKSLQFMDGLPAGTSVASRRQSSQCSVGPSASFDELWGTTGKGISGTITFEEFLGVYEALQREQRGKSVAADKVPHYLSPTSISHIHVETHQHVENKTQKKAIEQDLERSKYLHGLHDPSASRQSEAQAKEEHNTQMSQHMVKMKALHSTGASTAKGEAQQDIMDKHTREAFKRFDADGSGGIDADELRKALTSSGFGSDVLKVAMASFDKNGSGSIDYNEFCSMLAVLNKCDCDSEDTEGKGKIDITEKAKAVHEEKLKLLNSLQDAKAAVSTETAAHKLLHNSHIGSMYEKRQLAAEEAQLQLERQRREDEALELKVAEQHLQRRGSMARRRESLDKQNSEHSHSRHNLLRKCSLPSL